MAVNYTRKFRATAIYKNNTTKDVTEEAVWDSSYPEYATISNASGTRGVVSSRDLGETVISATFQDSTGNTKLTITEAWLVNIIVEPVNPFLAIGMKLQFTATGVFSDESTQDITDDVDWSSSDAYAGINDVDDKGLATGVSEGITTISAEKDTISGSTILTMVNANLIAVFVTPENPSIPKETSRQFRAAGLFSNGSDLQFTQDITGHVTWSSGTPSKATINASGLATAVNAGTSLIEAEITLGGVHTGSTTLTVTDATLESIVITPNNPICYGTTQQFTATGIFNDGKTKEITDIVVWASTDTDVATISNAAGSAGLATAKEPGTTMITTTAPVSMGSKNAETELEVRIAVLQSIVVTPENPTVYLPNQLQFKAKGVFFDGTTFEQDLTTQVVWESSSSGIAVVGNAAGSKGLASSVAVGTSSISATRDIVSGSTNLKVENDTVAPYLIEAVVSGVNKVRVTYSEALNYIQASDPASYVITKEPTGACDDNGNFDNSVQTVDFTIDSVTVISPSTYVLNLDGEMKDVKYTLIADRTEVRDTEGNLLGCPNNMDFDGADLTEPTVKSADSVDPTTIRVTFSENVNESEAKNKDHYKIVQKPVGGQCADNTNFTSTTQTADFNIASVSGSGKVYDLTLDATQVQGTSYSLVVNREGIHDLAIVPNKVGCPNYADFSGLEQLKVSSALSRSNKSLIVTFSKPVKAGVDQTGSAGCDGDVECGKRYRLSGPSSLGTITKARILDGSVCGGEAANDSRVCIEHSIEQGGGIYTVIAANGSNFSNGGWGSILSQDGTETLQNNPKDRADFNGAGQIPQTFADGPIVSNPFQDDSDFGYLAKYSGRIYIGPNKEGYMSSRFKPDGTDSERPTFEFNQDTTGSGRGTTRNLGAEGGDVPPPYYTIGHTGCTENSTDKYSGCGPDNNNGRGLFTSGTINISGDDYEHLFITGGRFWGSDGSNDYIYWTRVTGTVLEFNYIDTSDLFTGMTFYHRNGSTVDGGVGGNAGTESIVVFNNRIYWMAPGHRSVRPYLMKLNTLTAEAKKADNDGVYMHLANMTGFGPQSNTPNYAQYIGGKMFVYNDRLYIGNSGAITKDDVNCGPGATVANGCSQLGGLIRSANNNPGPCTNVDTCADWADITPSSAKFRNFFTALLPNFRDLIPAQQPIPDFAEYEDNLYMIRNACEHTLWSRPNGNEVYCGENDFSTNCGMSTSWDIACTAGQEVPQLWKCVPGGDGHCDAGDWSLVAEHGTTGKTNFGDTDNTKITLLITNGSYLYIGFDNAVDGVKIYRTNVLNPSAAADFSQIGGDGLGSTDNTQLFSAVSLPQGSVHYLYLSVGKSGVPVKVYRQQNM